MLLNGFREALTIQNLIACFAGVLAGTVVGVLPGIGPVSAMALLLPFSFGLDASTSLILLAGVYYGSMYGGSTTSILISVPGEGASVVTCIDGYQMAKKGRAGAALAAAAIGSFVAGTVGIILLMLFAPPLSNLALAFGPPEYLAISVLGIVLLNNLTGDSFLKSFLMLLVGMMISTIGIDPLIGGERMSFGILELSRGIDILPCTMGLFGMAELLSIAVKPYSVGELIKVKFRDLYPTKTEIKKSIMPIIRGSFIGFPLGLIPGPATLLASLLSYKVEKSVSKHPEEFGKGAIEGVAGPESANNAASSGAMVPLLALGIPFAPATAILLGAFMIHGVAPGPTLMTTNAALFWVIIASMYVGNVMLLLLNLPFVGVFASLTKLPARILMPIVAAIMFIGVYSVNLSDFDLWLLLILGLVGFFAQMIKYPVAPLVIGFVLEETFEKSIRQSLVLANGDISYIFQRPIAGTIFAVVLLVLIYTCYRAIKHKKIVIPDEE